MSTSQTSLQTTRWEQQRNEWVARAAQLDEGYKAARRARVTVAPVPSENDSPAAAAAGHAELAAAKAYNDFLETGVIAHRLSQDIANRLKSDGSHMSALERHALQIEQRNLERTSIEFQNFKSEARLVPVFPAPVYADNKVYGADGSVRWDPTTVMGQLGAAWDSVKKTAPELAHAPFTPEQQAAACENVLDFVAGTVIGKTLPAPGHWSAREIDVWDHLAGHGYPRHESPSATTCRLIYPRGGMPEHLQKYGAVTEDHGAVLGEFAKGDPGNDVWARIDRMLEASQTGDWATFRNHTQALAAMPAAQEMLSQAKATVDQQEQLAALHAQQVQPAQQQSHPVMRMTR